MLSFQLCRLTFGTSMLYLYNAAGLTSLSMQVSTVSRDLTIVYGVSYVECPSYGPLLLVEGLLYSWINKTID